MKNIRISIKWEVVNTVLVFGKGTVRIEEVADITKPAKLIYPEFTVHFDQGSWGCENMVIHVARKYWNVLKTMVENYRDGVELSSSSVRWINERIPPADHYDDESIKISEAI